MRSEILYVLSPAVNPYAASAGDLRVRALARAAWPCACGLRAKNTCYKKRDKETHLQNAIKFTRGP